MNPERLLAHYGRIADGPEAVPRLRRFILDLAVRGRLVPQDPNDEPASELLMRIDKEEARLVKAGEMRKAEPVADLTHTDHGLPVPQGWAFTNVHSVCTSVTDGDHLPPPKAETGVPFLVIGNVRASALILRAQGSSHHNTTKPSIRLAGRDVAISFTRWWDRTAYQSLFEAMNLSAFNGTSAFCARRG